MMTSLPTKEVKCQQDGKEPRSFGDENKGQSSAVEWGGQSPRNANSNFTAERVSKAEGSGEGSLQFVSSEESKRSNCLDRFYSMPGGRGEQGP